MRVVLLGLVVACGGSGETPSDGLVTLTFTNRPTNTSQLVVAYQDGDNAFTTLQPDASGAFSFPVVSDRYGVAVGCVSPGNTNIGLVFFAIDELTELTMTLDQSCTGLSPASFSGTITGIDGAYANLSIDPTNQMLYGPQTPNTFFLTGESPSDVAVVRFAGDPTAGPVQDTDGIAILRGQTAATDLVIDLSTAPGPDIVNYAVAAEPLDELAILQASVVTERNVILLGQDARQGAAGSSTLRVSGLPASLEAATDRYRVATTIARGGTVKFEEERVFDSLTDVASASFERIAPFSGTLTSGTFPGVQFTPHPTAQGYTYNAFGLTQTETVDLSAAFSVGWLGNETTLTIPALDELFAFGALDSTSVTARAEQSTLGVTDLPLPFVLRAPGPAGSVRASAGL